MRAGKRTLLLYFFIILLGFFSLTACGEENKIQSDLSSAGSVQPLSGNLSVSFLDVGQGDSIFIELPNSKTMLIDAGNPENGSDISSYIRNAGCNRIDYLIATHPHDDHIGGMPEIIRSFDIGSIFMPKASNNTVTFENLLSEIEQKGYKINTAKAGITILQDGNLKIDIVAPVKSSYKDLNNYSTVIKLVYGSTSFLFMGDAEKLSEQQITADVQADVFKVGHHGSDYSSSPAFLKKVTPSYAVISVGADNDYGHPAKAALDSLLSNGAEIFRTDLDGTIIFQSNGSIISEKNQSEAPSSTPSGLMSSSRNSGVNTEQTVFVTKTGSKYHLEDCPYLSESKIEIPLSKAELTYEPCSKCNPPQ